MNRQVNKEQRVAPMIKPFVGFCVEVGDPAAFLEGVEKLGGKTVALPAGIPDFALTWPFLVDPEGHAFGLSGGAVQ